MNKQCFNEGFSAFLKNSTADLGLFARTLCWRYLHTTDPTEDLVQDTLEVACIAERSGAYVTSYHGFARQVFRNQSMNLCSRTKRRARFIESNLSDEIPGSNKTFQEEYIDLCHALEEIGPTERDSILLFVVAGFSVAELAHHADVTEACMRKRLERTRARLRDAICAPTRRPSWQTHKTVGEQAMEAIERAPMTALRDNRTNDRRRYDVTIASDAKQSR